MRVSEIRVKQIRVNQGLGVLSTFRRPYVLVATSLCQQRGSGMRFVVFTPENARDSLAPGNFGKYHHKRQIVQIFENVVIGDNFGFGVCKGQLISKAISGLLTSSKKRTDEFVLFAFLLFTANKSNLSVRFLGESLFS